jgi:hypothetical protein
MGPNIVLLGPNMEEATIRSEYASFAPLYARDLRVCCFGEILRYRGLPLDAGCAPREGQRISSSTRIRARQSPRCRTVKALRWLTRGLAVAHSIAKSDLVIPIEIMFTLKTYQLARSYKRHWIVSRKLRNVAGSATSSC